MEVKISIKATDMDQSLQVNINQYLLDYNFHIKRKTEEITFKGIEISKQEKTLANFIKTELDKFAGLGWNCVVGRNFGSHITHQTKKYIYYTVKDFSILLWKS